MFERGVFWSHIMLRHLLVWCVSFGGGGWQVTECETRLGLEEDGCVSQCVFCLHHNIPSPLLSSSS